VESRDQQFARIYNDVHTYPYLRDVAAALGVSEKRVRNKAGILRRKPGAPHLVSRAAIAMGQEEKPQEFKHTPLIEAVQYDVGDETRYFILTAAQDGSVPHHDFLSNLEAYATWLGNCEIVIAGFTYNKSLFEDHGKAAAYFDPRCIEHMRNKQLQLGDNLLFCGEMNTLPTAVNPLSGFETYTRDKWGIFPHAKVQLTSVATAKFAPTKILMTTGAVTLPNYVQKKAGIKAGFHHVIGAVLVELLPTGEFFCRHLQADGLGEEEGGFFDLDRRVEQGRVTTGHRIEALTYGDIHHEKLDPVVAATTWDYDADGAHYPNGRSLLDTLKPRYQFFHDLSDFAPRNHHNIKDHHFRFATHSHKTANVRGALAGCAYFLQETKRPWCKSVVVQSNHDNALVTWLKTADYKQDPENAEFFLETELSYHRQLASGVFNPPIFEQTLRAASQDISGVEFVDEDSSFMIVGDIECAMHGHLGANGAKGSPRQYTRMGSKSNTGHTHSAQIIDGAYVAGVSGKLDQGYNRGLSSWSHSHILTYANGKRTILTMMGDLWFAPRLQNSEISKSSRDKVSCVV